jgi:hypothetical protein
VIGNVATVARSGETLEPEERRELLNAAERQAKRLARAAGEPRDVPPGRRDADARAAGSSCGRSPRRSPPPCARARANRAIEVLAPPQLDIVTDPTLLYRILYNLGDNAMKYSDDEVRFTVRCDSDEAWIAVTDRGWASPRKTSSHLRALQQLDAVSTHAAWARRARPLPVRPRGEGPRWTHRGRQRAGAWIDVHALPAEVAPRRPVDQASLPLRHTAKRTQHVALRTTYSLPSTRNRPFAFAASQPPHSTRSS